MPFELTWPEIESALSASPRVLLHGPPGLGKTHAGHKLGLKPNQRVFSITLTEQTSAAELQGLYVPKGGEFIYQFGPLVLAWLHGGRAVLNELQRVSGDAQAFLINILDDPGMALMTLPNGETVKPHADFSCVATMNGDPSELDEALRDRFPVCLPVYKPNPQAIASLPMDLQRIAENSVAIPDQARRVGLRSWIEFAQLRTRLGAPLASRLIFRERAQELENSLKIGSL